MTARKLLLVSSAFHGIWESIARGFDELGWQVEPHLYDDYQGVRAKLRNKIRYELPERVGRSSQRRRESDLGAAAAAAALSARPDAVLTVRGDMLGEQYWDALDRLGVPRVTWLYDQVSAMRFSDEDYTRLGGIGSFSWSDTALLQDRGLTAAYVALGFDPYFTPTGRRSGGIVFAGARYPQRERLLLDLQARGLPVIAYGRFWSHHPVDRLRTWDLRRPDLPSGRELDRDRAHQVMEEAAATINVHGAQDGFTLRTFEAAGIGAVQLIDRPDVEAFYAPGEEVLVYRGADELAELCRRAVRETSWMERLRTAARARSLAEHTFRHRAETLQGLML